MRKKPSSQSSGVFHQHHGKETAQGKKLNFITQEIGREVNTMGSKSNNAEMQQIVVRMKDELEQIKRTSIKRIISNNSLNI